MKKIVILIFSLFLLAGCSSTNVMRKTGDENNKQTTTGDLKDPILKSCELYNPNGFNTITCVVSNPNKEDIDITYDLVFYKDGKEVYRAKDYSNINISSKHDDIIWANADLPDPSKVDEIKMENIFVEKAYYKSIDTTIKYDRTVGNYVYLKVSSKTKPTLTNIWVLFYNDNNYNKKYDQGEIVVTDYLSLMEKEGEVKFDTQVFSYTDYEIYYNSN